MKESDIEKRGDNHLFTKSIVDTLPFPLLLIAPDLTVISANEAFYRKFQVGRAAIEGKPVTILCTRQTDKDGLYTLLANILSRDKAPENIRLKYDYSETETWTLDLNARKMDSGNGERSAFLLTIQDITVCVNDRRALKELKERYQELVEEINSIIIEMNKEGEITFFNRFSEYLFGYSREEMIGKKMVGTIIPEKDSEGNDNSNLVAEIRQDPDRLYFNETQGIRKDGSDVWFAWSACLVRNHANGPLIRIDGNDITRERNGRKELEDAFNIIQSTGVAVMRLDAQKNFLFANQTFLELVDKPAEAVEGRSLAGSGLSKTMIGQLTGAIDNALRTREDQVLEARFRDKHLLVRVEPMLEKTQDACWTVVFFNDTTPLKEAQEKAAARAKQLQTMAVNLIEAEEKERQRISDILHEDLQQMLAIARMQIETVSRQSVHTPVLENATQLIGTSIETCRKLSYELTPPVLHQLDLERVLWWLVNHVDKEFGLTVQLSVENPVQLTDSSLKIFLFRAVQELLHNIARHSGVKSARVILSDAADVVTITVSDEGKGFHPEELRGAIEKSRLGIASLRERTRAFGGTLSIESTPGSGSSFTLTRASA